MTLESLASDGFPKPPMRKSQLLAPALRSCVAVPGRQERVRGGRSGRGLHFKVSSSLQSTAQAGAGAGGCRERRVHLDGMEGHEAEGGRGHGARKEAHEDRGEDPHCTTLRKEIHSVEEK
jgi:hypothetical protein